MIRPEARQTIWHWRESAIGLAIATLGIWLTSGFGVIRWTGLALSAAGLIMAAMGAQRALMRTRHPGPGIITADERELSYFGPLTGGTRALADVVRIELDPSGQPAHWLLHTLDQPPLAIPTTASGNDTLIDALAALPGFSVTRAVRAATTPPAHILTIWHRPD